MIHNIKYHVDTSKVYNAFYCLLQNFNNTNILTHLKVVLIQYHFIIFVLLYTIYQYIVTSLEYLYKHFWITWSWICPVALLVTPLDRTNHFSKYILPLVSLKFTMLELVTYCKRQNFHIFSKPLKLSLLIYQNGTSCRKEAVTCFW